MTKVERWRWMVVGYICGFGTWAMAHYLGFSPVVQAMFILVFPIIVIVDAIYTERNIER